MSEHQFHSFPFHSFLKEYMLGTGGMNKLFMSTPTLSLVPQTHGNGWEPVGTGEHSAINRQPFGSCRFVSSLFGITQGQKHSETAIPAGVNA